jgi:DNA-binding NarL/FixJ family response regulator
MEFKHKEFVEREKEIAGYLLLDFSLKQICNKTGLQKKIVAAHIQNMMEKLGAENMETLIQLLKL